MFVCVVIWTDIPHIFWSLNTHKFDSQNLWLWLRYGSMSKRQKRRIKQKKKIFINKMGIPMDNFSHGNELWVSRRAIERYFKTHPQHFSLSIIQIMLIWNFPNHNHQPRHFLLWPIFATQSKLNVNLFKLIAIEWDFPPMYTIRICNCTAENKQLYSETNRFRYV